MVSPVTRRRFIKIAGAAAGFGVVPGLGCAAAGARSATWQGHVMGATAMVTLYHPDRVAAERLIGRVLDEVRRLERIFSLYREDSALATLNRTGVLIAPPAELIDLLTECRRYSDLSDGTFDPTVQPLWTVYYSHFAMPGADPGGPARGAIEGALAKVGMDKVFISPDRIGLAQRGMALTLNGVAQGYVTDRAIELLRAAGIEHSLADLGEIRAIGARPDGGPWRVALPSREDLAPPAHESLPIVDRAVATSSAYGFKFDSAGRFNHLFDARTGACADRYLSMTVVAPTALAADALSTTLSFTAEENIAGVLRAGGGESAHLIARDGTPLTVRG